MSRDICHRPVKMDANTGSQGTLDKLPHGFLTCELAHVERNSGATHTEEEENGPADESDALIHGESGVGQSGKEKLGCTPSFLQT